MVNPKVGYTNLKYESVRIEFKTVVFIRANPGKKEITDGSGSHVNFIQKQCTFPEVVSPEKWYVTNIKPCMGLVIPQRTYPHRPNIYSHSHVYSSLARSVHWSGNEIILPVTTNLNFWSRAIFWNLALPGKVHRSRKKMHANPISLWFLSYLGWLL